ncbi:hypothetical protein [Streptomyces sp. NPDC051572]|uniref:hypothetical protein n=1 Tax=Streptomyces sp. NPDC051572 TaxID=3155802 RepID=UPI00344E045A
MSMPARAESHYPWVRRVHEYGAPLQVDRFGWLAEMPWARAGASMADRRDDRVLVVVGERGCGKSDLLVQETAALQAQGHTAFLVNLAERGRFFDTNTAGQDLDAVLEQACQGEAGFVLLDSLDEGLDRLAVLDEVLVVCLRRLGTQERARLRLRIACRSGRLPRGLEDDLRSLWAPGAVSVVGVTPLGRSDVETAAVCEGIDPQMAVRRLHEKGTVALAWSPITLIPLLRAERDGQSLPSTVADAYRIACRQLCSHGHRDGNPLSPEHLMALACRVAAVLEFGQYTAVHDTASRAEAAPADVALNMLEGGGERGGDGTPYHCGMRELLALVDSGLMTAVGPRRWAFAHDSYQQYLAAQFLTRHGLRGASQRQLLWIGDGTARHIVKRHREVAAWQVVDDHELFDEVLRDDPEVLLLADLMPLRDDRREALVDRLLTLAGDDDTVRLDRWQLHRLRHERLADHLRPYLSPLAPRAVLAAALSIARACQPPGLNDQLLTIAETHTVDADLRRRAVQALHEDLRAGQVARLRALAEHNDTTLDDRQEQQLTPEQQAWIRSLAWQGDADLAAAALERLWPQHLRLPEFLDLIPPSGNPAAVRAAWLLIERTPSLLRHQDIDEAVTWASRVLSAGHPRAGLTDAGQTQLAVNLPVRVLARVIVLLDQEDTEGTRTYYLDQIADALLSLAGREDFDDRYQPARAVGEVLAQRPVLCREVGCRVLERGDEHQVTRLLFGPNSPVLSTAEPVYWALQWPALSPQARRHAAWLVSVRPDPADPDLPEARVLRERYPDLKAATSQWDTPADDDAEQQHVREEEHFHGTFSEARLHHLLTLLTGAEGRVDHLWQEITSELYRTTDGSEAPQDRWLDAVPAAPSLPPEDSELHHLLVNAAITVVRRSTTLADAVAGPATTDWNRTATTLTALAVLDSPHLAQALGQDPRRAAAAVVALAVQEVHHPADIARKHQLITRCTHLATTDLPGFLSQALDGCTEPELTSLTDALAGPTAPETADLLRTWACAPTRTDAQSATVLATLARAGDRPSENILSAAISDLNLQHDAGQRDSRWARATAALMESARLPEAWPAIKAILTAPGALAALLDRIIAMDPHGSWPAGTSQLAEADLAGLYEHVTDHITVSRLTDNSFDGGFTTDPLSTLHAGLLALLVSKRTPDAVREVTRLAGRYPQLTDLRWHAKDLPREVAELQVRPLTPEQLRRLAADSTLRTVTDARHLQDIVLASLDRIQAIIQGPNYPVIVLWNRDDPRLNQAKCWPCWEDDFSDFITALLRQDIGGHRVVINREVEIARPRLPGRRTDIQVQATAPPSEHGDGPLTVVIECKGCWNRDLPTALADQLVRDYLRTPRTAGIYLIGYFDCPRWDEDDRRRRHRAVHTIEALQQEQDARAQEQCDQHGAVVTASILDCRLPGTGHPHPSGSAAAPHPEAPGSPHQ